jgi:hypothetical protein
MILNSPTISGSLTVTGNIIASGSITLSGSVASASYADTASFVALAQSASYVLTAQTASFVANAQTASFVALAQSASNAVAAQTASFANAFTVAGTLTAQTLVVQTITSSVDFVTGSTRFGSILGNTHVFTGSLQTTGSNTFSGYSIFSSSINEVARFKSSYANGVYLTFESGSTTIGDIGNSSEVFTGASTLDFGINARGNRKLQLGVNQTPVMTISGNNVGVGVITPARPFHVHIGATSYSTPVGISSTSTVLGTNLATYAELQLIGNTAYGAGILLGDTANGQSGSILQFGGTAGEGGRMRFIAGGTETMNLRGGNVGIGTSSPSYTLSFNGDVATTIGMNQGTLGTAVPLTLKGSDGPNGTNNEGGPIYISSGLGTGNANTSNIIFSTAPSGNSGNTRQTLTERMRITSGGIIQLGSSERRNALQQSTFGYGGSYRTLLIGSTGTDYTTNAVTLAFNVDLSGNPSGAYGGDGSEYFWRNVGSFKTPNSSNNGYNTLLSWNSSGVVTVTTSDYRAKEDLKSFEALPMVEAMKLYDFRWIELQNRMHGVLAHELQDIVPYAVMGEKDGESMQGVDYSKLVPVMLKSIQELKTQNDALQSRIETLESK